MRANSPKSDQIRNWHTDQDISKPTSSRQLLHKPHRGTEHLRGPSGGLRQLHNYFRCNSNPNSAICDGDGQPAESCGERDDVGLWQVLFGSAGESRLYSYSLMVARALVDERKLRGIG